MNEKKFLEEERCPICGGRFEITREERKITVPFEAVFPIPKIFISIETTTPLIRCCECGECCQGLTDLEDDCRKMHLKYEEVCAYLP